MELVDQSSGTLSDLQKTATGVVMKLPASDAKVTMQKELLQLQDKYEQ